jgi:hypothetical protein
MTESEWLACTDPLSMLHVIQHSRPSERKVRLFNAAICRRFWDYLPEGSRAILVESELLADGMARESSDGFELCSRANGFVAPFDRKYPTKQFPSKEVRIQRDASAAVCYAVIPNNLFGANSYFTDIDPGEKGPQSDIIRDVFGNPFRPLAVDPVWLAWNDGSVVQLAQTIYEQRRFAVMPVLADALEEAGCTNADLLDHSRGPGPHVRGCWLLDLLLGKG